MQGRLLPKYKNRFQAHPKNYWQSEFNIAHKLGFDCIEFILDFEDWDSNPLMTSDGLKEIDKLTLKENVKVLSVCADYFMEQPVFSKQFRTQNIQVLKKLMVNCSKIGIRDIIIPLVDNSSILDDDIKHEQTVFFLREILETTKNTLNLTLETDLPPKQFSRLIDQINNKSIKVNYDIGNSASLGYNFEDEMNAYGKMISNIHIKDRLLGGGSVELGKGASKFSHFFQTLSKLNYGGIFILQAFRGDDAIASIKPQIEYIKNIMSSSYQTS